MPEAMFTSSSTSSGFLHTSLDEVNETVIWNRKFSPQREKMKSAPHSDTTHNSRWLIKAGYYGSCYRLAVLVTKMGLFGPIGARRLSVPGT